MPTIITSTMPAVLVQREHQLQPSDRIGVMARSLPGPHWILLSRSPVADAGRLPQPMAEAVRPSAGRPA